MGGGGKVALGMAVGIKNICANLVVFAYFAYLIFWSVNLLLLLCIIALVAYFEEGCDVFLCGVHWSLVNLFAWAHGALGTLRGLRFDTIKEGTSRMIFLCNGAFLDGCSYIFASEANF